MAFLPNGTGFTPTVDLPGPNPLSIGPLTLPSVECPEKLPIGALEQKLAVTLLLGGGKDVQSNGVQPKSLSFSGVLWQPNIVAHKNLIRALMVSGKEYLITWMDEQWYGKISAFTPTANHANRCPYEITVEITRAANGALTSTQIPTVDQQVAAITSNAQTQNATITSADPTGSAGFQQALSTALTAVAAAGPIAQLVAPQTTQLIASVLAATQAVTTYAGTVTEGASQYVATQQLLAYLQLLSTNINRGQSTQTVRVQGVSLFELAAQYYGEPSYAFALADINGLPSPYTSTQVPTVVALPPFPSSSS